MLWWSFAEKGDQICSNLHVFFTVWVIPAVRLWYFETNKEHWNIRVMSLFINLFTTPVKKTKIWARRHVYNHLKAHMSPGPPCLFTAHSICLQREKVKVCFVCVGGKLLTTASDRRLHWLLNKFKWHCNSHVTTAMMWLLAVWDVVDSHLFSLIRPLDLSHIGTWFSSKLSPLFLC